MEVPTEEELKALQTSAEQATELQKQVDELSKLKETYEKDPVQKNWNAIRAKTERMEAALKAQGKTVDDEGNVIEQPKSITAEEIEEKARKAARSEMVGQQKRNLLAKYDDEQRKLVEHYLNKLTAGEEINIDNLEKFVQEADILANPNQTAKSAPFVAGQPPRIKGIDENRFSDTDEGSKLANEIFGDESFAKKK
jgi:coenzyme F420-reducing hydrogenase alpha subunit